MTGEQYRDAVEALALLIARWIEKHRSARTRRRRRTVEANQAHPNIPDRPS
jgi:hypothetical protein